MNLPNGWRYTPRVPAKQCSACGHREPEQPAMLYSPSGGQEWVLVGNTSAAQEREMVSAIVKANSYPGDEA
jgi:hypothetical protein